MMLIALGIMIVAALWWWDDFRYRQHKRRVAEIERRLAARRRSEARQRPRVSRRKLAA
jgi:hypothetical protein